jgi:20S proteasome subunit beta 6
MGADAPPGARQRANWSPYVRASLASETRARAREDEAIRDHSIRSARGFDRDASTTAWTMDDDDATARAVSTSTRDARVASNRAMRGRPREGTRRTKTDRSQSTAARGVDARRQDNNGGTVLAVAGENYVICASDSRMSSGYNILTRNYEKVDHMSPKVLMASAGFAADAQTLKKTLRARCKQYEFQNKKPIGCVSFAQMLSNTLYYRRFFPYYAFNIVAGLDAEGKGAVFTYDAVGSYERTNYSCQGSGQALIMPVLDHQLKTVSPLVLPAVSSATPLSEAQAIDLIKDCFATATERDIYTGDRVDIWIMNAEGVRKEEMALRTD